MRVIKKDSTSQSVTVRILDDTSGLPEEAVAFDTSGLAIWYRREGGLKVSVTPATLSALDASWSSGGILHIDDGYYRVDIPDAAFSTGSDGVQIGGTVTGMVINGCYVPLVAYDPQDGVRLGLTSLPNAAASVVGGLPTVDGSNAVKVQSGTGANQISLSSGAVVVQSGTSTGQLSLSSGAVVVQSGTGTGQIDLSSGAVKVQVGTGTGQIAASSGIVSADIKKVNAVTVSGTGATGDDWGPA